MKERPILFSPPMVRALLRDVNPKTQTRRIVKFPLLSKSDGAKRRVYLEKDTDEINTYIAMRQRNPMVSGLCPLGQIGDRLWVREAWRVGKKHDKLSGKEIWEHLEKSKGQGVTVLYEVGGWKSVSPFKRIETIYSNDEGMPSWAGRKRIGRFMPRWASRITLEITNVHIQRVQEISEEDAVAEGIDWAENDFGNGPSYCDYGIKNREDTAEWFASPIDSFRSLWDSINGNLHPWSDNNWVWAITFRKLEE